MTRREEQRDPEAEAEFDRELAKLMSEGAESRKFDRKQVFDVPLPMRRNVPHAMPATGNEHDEAKADVPTTAPNTMKFALLSRRGNKPQVRASIPIASSPLTAVDPGDRPAL